jgi:hypothetical protein
MNENQTSITLNQNHKRRRSVSLRTKILLGSLIIVLFSVAAMGYFVFYRLQSANEFLVNQFDLSVDREIEYRLAVLTANEANDISLFFSSMENVIETFGDTASSLLSKDASVVLEDENWNAYVELKQLPTGSWDNSNEEPASIFLPANVIIQDDLAKELVTLKGLDFFVKGL